VTTLERYEAAQQGEPLVAFSLLGPAPDDRPLACVRVAANAAALALPEPALAVAGKHAVAQADLAVVAGDYLLGLGLIRAGVGDDLISADAPVDVDWDLRTGELEIAAGAATIVSLRLAGTASPRVVEGTGTLAGQGAAIKLTAPAGRHSLEGAVPDAAALAKLSDQLAQVLAEGLQRRAAELARPAATELLELPAPAPDFDAQVGGAVTDLEVMAGRGPLLCAAEGPNVHIIAPDGSEVRSLKADSDVRVLRWWPEHELLLVGSAQGLVTAFDATGQRRWVFKSEEDPSVAATGWTRDQPGMRGIHGLYSGAFRGGESQAFVGSASTLEVIDEGGKLLDRYPYLWGTLWRFAIVDAGPGGKTLIAAPNLNGRNEPMLITAENANPQRRGFYQVPEGHTFVSGWSAMNRAHLFYEDLDGDGVREVVSETNGSWNRVTVWSAEGKPLHDASFGPGAGMAVRTMRDLEVADLDGDGTKEILVATSGGLIVCLNHQCERVWSRRLAVAPDVMKAFGSGGDHEARIVVGCEDGSVVVLDRTGTPVMRGQVEGQPMQIESIETSGGPVAIIGTGAGRVVGVKPW